MIHEILSNYNAKKYFKMPISLIFRSYFMAFVAYFVLNDIDGTPCGAETKQVPLIPKP